MREPHKRTEFKKWPLTIAALCAAASAVLWALNYSRLNGDFQGFYADFLLLGFGWGPPLLSLEGIGWILTAAHSGLKLQTSPLFWGSLGLWAVAAGALPFGIKRNVSEAAPPSEATSAPLYPRLKGYRDFYWSTLAAYGFGIFFAELAVVLLQMWLAGNVDFTGEVQKGFGPGLAPLTAFAISGLTGALLAFGFGMAGTLRARRLAGPEATIGILYFGLPIPILLTVLLVTFDLMPGLQRSMREVLYLCGLLGNVAPAAPWLGFVGLVLCMVLGITSGFVVSGSGRIDLRAGTELFIARRHVSIFRPRLLLGGLAVLIFGIIPPLLIYAILRAAENAVERTRIRQLGERDPLDASRALHAQKLREQTPTAMMTSLSVGGVGVGVMALIIVLSVMSGFEEDLQKKILGTNAHIVVMKYSDDFSEYPDTMKQVHRVAEVTGVTPFILNQVMVAGEGTMDGSIIKGIDPDTVGQVTDLPKNILPPGKIEYLSHPEEILVPRLAPNGGAAIDGDPADGKKFKIDGDSGAAGKGGDLDIIREPTPEPETKKPERVLPGIILGKELAANLKVVVGDRVNVVTPVSEELGPSGPVPKSRPFRVAGIFYSGMYEYDSKMVYIDIKEARAFFNVKGVTGLEVKVSDIDDARRIAKQILKVLDGYPYRTKDWGEMNKNLFSALRLEKLVMAIILSIIVIVAAGLIIATVIMLVLEKRKEIAVLKALGVSDGGILKIFLAEGLQIGIAGSLLGLIAGLAWCVFIQKVGIKLDPEVYYIPALPVKVVPLQTAVPVIIAVLVSFLASVYPALKASHVEPVEGLKAE